MNGDDRASEQESVELPQASVRVRREKGNDHSALTTHTPSEARIGGAARLGRGTKQHGGSTTHTHTHGKRETRKNSKR